MDIRLLPSQEHDIDEVLEMMKAFYLIDKYPFDRDRASASMLQFISDPHLGQIYLIKEKKVLGYLIVCYGFSFLYGGRGAFIDELFIKEEYRGKGVGDKVIALIEKKLKANNITALHLEVERHNTNALKLYTKNGFEDNGRSTMTKIYNTD